MPLTTNSPTRRPWVLPLAFGFIYFSWGATYLATKWAVADIPALLMTGSRFLIAGLLLLAAPAVMDRSTFHFGTRREWWECAKIGALFLAFGIGTGNWAQQYVDSSFAAMVFSALPLWIIVIDWLRPGGLAPTRTVVVALIVGCAGILMILAPAASGTSRVSQHLGLDLLLILASLSWATGAIFSRYVTKRGSPLLPVGRQMTVGGAILLLAGIFHGDTARLHFVRIGPLAWIGFVYLVVIGSFAGYPVYIWLMRVCPTSKAATIPYVNLLVAVLLGCSLGHERITPRLLAGTAIVLLSVTIALRARAPVTVPPGD